MPKATLDEDNKDFLDGWDEASPPSEDKSENVKPSEDDAPKGEVEAKDEGAAQGEVEDDDAKGDKPEETGGEKPKETESEDADAKDDHDDEDDESEEKAPPSEQKSKPAHEEFKGYLDEREKRQKAERERDELRKRIEAFEQQQKQVQEKPQPPPDPIDDWEGYQAYQKNQQEQFALNQKLHQSEFFAVREFGKERVETAYKAAEANANPALRDRIFGAASPYHELIDWYENEYTPMSLIKEAGGLEALIKKRAEANSEQPQEEQPAGNAGGSVPKVTPPPSLAKTGSGKVKTSSNAKTESDFFASVVNQ